MTPPTDEPTDEHDRELVRPLIRLIGKLTQGCEFYETEDDGWTAIGISLEELLTADEVALVQLAGKIYAAQENEIARLRTSLAQANRTITDLQEHR